MIPGGSASLCPFEILEAGWAPGEGVDGVIVKQGVDAAIDVPLAHSPFPLRGPGDEGIRRDLDQCPAFVDEIHAVHHLSR